MMNEVVRTLLSNTVNTSILNRQYWVQLPNEQQKILNEILEEIHSITTSVNKISANECKVLPQYRAQVQDAIVLKLATEFGMINGGR